MSPVQGLRFASAHGDARMPQSDRGQQERTHNNKHTYEPVPSPYADTVPESLSSTPCSTIHDTVHSVAHGQSSSISSSTAYEPEHLELKSAKRTSSKRLPFKRISTVAWLFEITALIISVGSIVSIIALLHRENGRPVSTWRLSITLNTIIAVLGTLARTTLAFALSACIGQQKWNWLRRKPDSLVAWERFDEASRGPWGGTRLFCWLRARHWAALGALVTVGAIAFDPFLQAVLSTRGQLDNIATNPSATVGQSLRIDSGSIYQPHGAAIRDAETELAYTLDTGSRADFGFVSSVWSGFQNTSNFRNDAIGAECSTGNCTWPVFTSAAVCSACEDVASSVSRRQVYGMNGTNVPSLSMGLTRGSTYEGDYVKFELPYANIRNYFGFYEEEKNHKGRFGDPSPRTNMTANITTEANRTVAFQHIETLLMAFTVMKAPEDWLNSQITWEDATPVATECALYLCANAYESRSENNILTEQILDSWAVRAPDSYGVASNAWNSGPSADAWVKSLGSRLHDARVVHADLQLLIPSNESEFLPPDARREFNISHAFIYSAIDFLVGYTKVRSKLPDDDPLNTTKGPPDETWDMLAVPWIDISQPVVSEALSNSTNLTVTFDNVARSLTNQIRNSSPDRHQGEVKQWVIHVHVDWAYLAYPISMLLAGILYVVLIIIESTRLRMPVWKESALPTLLHGFDDETQRLLRAGSKEEQRRVMVRFEQDEGDYLRLKTQC